MKPNTERADSSWMRIITLVAFVGILGLAAVGCGGNEQAGVTIDPCNGCWDYPPPPVVTLTASPTSVAYGASSTLTWSSRDATSCTASGAWSGTQATAGSASTGALNFDSTFTLTCTGPGGSTSASVTVTTGTIDPCLGCWDY
jgi:hypothetical protein